MTRPTDAVTVALDEEDRVELDFMLRSRGSSGLKTKLLLALAELESKAGIHTEIDSLRADEWTATRDALPRWDGPSQLGYRRTINVLVSDGTSAPVLAYMERDWDAGPSNDTWFREGCDRYELVREPLYWHLLPELPELPTEKSDD